MKTNGPGIQPRTKITLRPIKIVEGASCQLDIASHWYRRSHELMSRSTLKIIANKFGGAGPSYGLGHVSNKTSIWGNRNVGA